MPRNVKIAAVSILAISVMAGAASVALWKPAMPDLVTITGLGQSPKVVPEERTPWPAPAQKAERPLSQISDVFHPIDPSQYEASIAQSKLSTEDAKVLRKLLPEGKVHLAGLVMSGQGQTISISGVGLKQTIKLEPKQQTLTVPYIPGVQVTFSRDKDDQIDGVIRIHANRTAVISMQALVPGAEVKMSTPKS